LLKLGYPLTELTTKNAPDNSSRSNKQNEALCNLKQSLCDAAQSNLTVIDFSKSYDIFVDASKKAVSGILTNRMLRNSTHQLLSLVKNSLIRNENGLL